MAARPTADTPEEDQLRALSDEAYAHVMNAQGTTSGRRTGWVMISTILIEAWDLYSISFLLVFVKAEFQPSALMLGLASASVQLGALLGTSPWLSVAYTDLPGVFIVHSIWDETETLLGWDDTVDWAERLELPVVPVLYRGVGISSARAAWARQRDPARSEGFVVRSAGRIPAAEYPFAVLQWVRPLHDLTPSHPTTNEFA